MDRQILTNGPIFDVERKRFVNDLAVVIEADRIVDLIPQGQIPTQGEHKVVDVGGGHILPGFIDTHFHLMSRSGAIADDALITRGTIDAVITARRALEAGLTSVRDPGCRHRGLYSFRDEIASGRVLGPRAFVAGPNLCGTGAPVDWRNRFVDGVAEVIHAVRDEVRAGGDMIKLVLSHTSSSSGWTECIRFLNDDEIRAAIHEAHLLGVPVGCHCEGIAAAAAVIEAGVDVVDHGLNLNEELAARMAEQSTFYAPTLWAFSTKTQANIGGTISEASRSMYDERIAKPHREAVQMAMAAGVRITVGSDPVHWIPARDVFICELEALVDAGMSPKTPWSRVRRWAPNASSGVTIWARLRRERSPTSSSSMATRSRDYVHWNAS